MKLVPQGRVQHPTIERAPVRQPREKTVEAATLIPRKRVHQRIVGQIREAPPFVEEIVEMVRSALISECNSPPLREEIVEEVRSVPRERVQQRTAELVPVPQILKNGPLIKTNATADCFRAQCLRF